MEHRFACIYENQVKYFVMVADVMGTPIGVLQWQVRHPTLTTALAQQGTRELNVHDGSLTLPSS